MLKKKLLCLALLGLVGISYASDGSITFIDGDYSYTPVDIAYLSNTINNNKEGDYCSYESGFPDTQTSDGIDNFILRQDVTTEGTTYNYNDKNSGHCFDTFHSEFSLLFTNQMWRHRIQSFDYERNGFDIITDAYDHGTLYGGIIPDYLQNLGSLTINTTGFPALQYMPPFNKQPGYWYGGTDNPTADVNHVGVTLVPGNNNDWLNVTPMRIGTVAVSGNNNQTTYKIIYGLGIQGVHYQEPA
ncbi:hypothetical protein, partial [Cysteiniphilum halobium]|uniref:hypothetical protein n=1 Tax=Cysteiniphilum halobium TaxID=2219059 RepID=UPI0013C330A6